MCSGDSGAPTSSARCKVWASRPPPARRELVIGFAVRPTAAMSGSPTARALRDRSPSRWSNAPTSSQPWRSCTSAASRFRSSTSATVLRLHRDQLVRVHVAAHARGTQRLDRGSPRRGHHDAVNAAAAELGRLGPPLGERRVLGTLAHRLGGEGRGLSPDHPSCSHMFTVWGHAPVEPSRAHTP